MDQNRYIKVHKTDIVSKSTYLLINKGLSKVLTAEDFRFSLSRACSEPGSLSGQSGLEYSWPIYLKTTSKCFLIFFLDLFQSHIPTLLDSLESGCFFYIINGSIQT